MKREHIEEVGILALIAFTVGAAFALDWKLGAAVSASLLLTIWRLSSHGN